MTTVKFGILGTAGIAQKVCLAIAEAPNAVVHAIASRDKSKAEEYAKEHAPGAKGYGSYDELLNDPEVQVVYLPLPTAVRGEWVLKAAAKKKHVLCEKPISATPGPGKELIDVCRENRVQFMDNTMFMHNDLMMLAKKAIEDESVVGGSAKLVTSTFSIPYGLDPDWAKTNIRMNRSNEPLGAIGDLGWYCVRVTLWAFNFDMPESVSCTFLEETAEGVPLHAVATLKFSNKRVATFQCSFMHPWRQWVEVTGAKGQLQINDFVIANSKDQTFTVVQNDMADKAVYIPTKIVQAETVSGCTAHAKLIEKFSNIVSSGELEDFWPDISIKTQTILGALMASARKDGAWTTPRAPTGKGSAYSGKDKGSSKGKGKTKDKGKARWRPKESVAGQELKVVIMGIAGSRKTEYAVEVADSDTLTSVVKNAVQKFSDESGSLDYYKVTVRIKTPAERIVSFQDNDPWPTDVGPDELKAEGTEVWIMGTLGGNRGC